MESSQSSWESKGDLHPPDVSFLFRKSSILMLLAQPHPPHSLSPRGEQEEARREKSGQRGGAGLPDTHQKCFHPCFPSSYAMDFDLEKIVKIHFTHTKRPCIIETNAGVTRTNIFSPTYCVIYFMLNLSWIASPIPNHAFYSFLLLPYLTLCFIIQWRWFSGCLVNSFRPHGL